MTECFSMPCRAQCGGPDGRGVQGLGQFVIVVYHPRAGKEDQLIEMVRAHVPMLRLEGLATTRPSQVMRSSDGTILEIFEWMSAEATEAAHTNVAVQAMWGRFGAVCEFGRLGDLEESKHLFPHFEPIDL